MKADAAWHALEGKVAGTDSEYKDVKVGAAVRCGTKACTTGRHREQEPRPPCSPTQKHSMLPGLCSQCMLLWPIKPVSRVSPRHDTQPHPPCRAPGDAPDGAAAGGRVPAWRRACLRVACRGGPRGVHAKEAKQRGSRCGSFCVGGAWEGCTRGVPLACVLLAGAKALGRCRRPGAKHLWLVRVAKHGEMQAARLRMLGRPGGQVPLRIPLAPVPLHPLPVQPGGGRPQLVVGTCDLNQGNQGAEQGLQDKTRRESCATLCCAGWARRAGGEACWCSLPKHTRPPAGRPPTTLC